MTEADRLRNDPDALNRLIEEHMVLKQAIQHAPILYCVYGPDDTLLAWNPAYEKNHPEAFATLNDAPPDTRLTYGDLVRHQIARQLPEDQVEAEVARRVAMQQEADGLPVIRHYESSGWSQIYKYRLPSGAVAGLAIDINAHKKREAELIEARHAAESAERVKAGFLAKMSHEIRTPMNGVIGMAETLIETELSGDQRLSLETILSSGEALLTLINDILDFSKIEAGKMELSLRPFSLVDEAEALCRLLAPRARALGLDMILDIDPTLDIALVGDSARLRQIMTNLLGNALKFTPSGHVLLRIDGHDLDSKSHRGVTITVQDTGIGIPPDRQQSVFQPFEQLQNPDATRIGGTGLGLSITAELIAAMDGKLTLGSTPGQGSTFSCSLTLPLAKRSDDKLSRLPLPICEPGRRGLLYLVDPSPQHAAGALRTLRHLGFVPQHWLSFAEFKLAQGDHSVAHPVVISDRALPRDPAECDAALARLAQRIPRGMLLWNRRTPPPRALTFAVHHEPIALSGWHDALCEGPRIAAPATAPIRAGLLDLDVLVAEDNRTNRLVLERMLQQRVSRLEFVENGQLAVEKALASTRDVILMDMAMPVMGGLEATRMIRELEARQGKPRCVIIALTANAMASDHAACLAAGMDDFLTKPVRMNALVDILATIDTRTRLTG